MRLLLIAVCVSLNAVFSAGQEEGAGQEEVATDGLNQFIEDYWKTSTTESNPELENAGDQYTAEQGTENELSCCVPYYLCDDKNNTKTVKTNGEGLIDIRFNPKAECKDIFEVCCSPENTHKTPIGQEEYPVTPSHETPSHETPSHESHETSSHEIPPYEPTSTTPSHHVEPVGCGHRNQDGVGFRITGAYNNEAQFGEFPWMIAVLKEEPCNCDSTHMLNVYQCGGSLISPKVVLTGAHCVYQKNPSTLKVRAGEWDTQTKNELFPHHDRRVQDIIFHEEYYAGALHNDVALLILDEPFDYKENINVACLPDQDAEFDEPECFATGWGKDVFGKQGKYQVILKKVELPTVPRSICQSALRKTRLGPHFKLHHSFICAGGEKGKDTCKGDGGSPLVCPIKSKPGVYAQVGIVAWGIGCGEDGTPGVYVNVAKFRHWIDEKLSELNLDTSAYTYS